MRWWGLRDLVVDVLVMTLAVGTTWTTVETAEAQSEEAPEWLDDLVPATSDDDPVAPPAQESEPAPLVESEGTQAAEVTWPSAGSSIVTLAGEGEPAATQGGLVEIAPGTDAVDGDRVEVRVLGHDVAQQVGVSGFLFELSGQGESVGELGGRGGLPAEVAIDYAGFEHAYGAGYLDRLHVVALPRCVLEDPRPDDCGAAGVTLPTRIDARAGQVVASIADVGALMSSSDGTAVVAAMPPAEAAEPHDSDGEVVFAVTSGPSGETGNFGATPLSASGDWQVAPGSGEFSYSYPLSVPAPPAGDAPDVGLAYSSGAVDGMVSTRNTQSPMSGVGWGDFAGSFVERRYESCADTVGTGDLCWKSDNATIHLNGRSSEMVKRPDGTWLLKNDPGWKVERLTGASNGDDDGEHWKVTTPDGVQYFFGLGRNPDVAVQTTSSAWYVPVWADHAGEPCRAANNTLGGCNQAWRWNLDRVVDPNGMATTYFYSTAMNWYLVLGGLGDTRDDYIRGGHLERIEYGKPVGTGTDVSPTGRVLFERQFRCAFLVESCPGPTRNSDTGYPDVPVDLLCNGADDTACLATTPTFFTASRYSAVRTEVYYGGDWHKVDQWNLSHTFLENSDGDQKLYLTAIQRVGLSQSGMLPLPAVNFWPVEKPNRVDVNLAEGRRPMGHFRVDRIVDEYGHETRVNYGQKSTCPATKVGPSIRWDQNTQDCFPQKVGTKWATFHKYLTTRVDEIDPTGGSPTMTTTYTYEGTAAWHHEDDEFVSSADQSWSDWRGYHTTRIRQGASDTRIRVFRGMRGDRQQSGGPRDESLTSLVDSSRSFFDEPWLAGTVLEEASYGALGEILQSNLYEYEVRIRAQVGNDPQDWAYWAGERASTTYVARAVNVFEQQRTTTTYNASLQPETALEEGWLSQGGDERCTRTSYANNVARNMLTFPSEVVTVAGGCSSTSELAHSQTYYDNLATLGAAPSRGNPTSQRAKVDATTWVTTVETTFDAYGRPLDVRDAAGLVTQTRHSATINGGFPTTTTVTNVVNGQAHSSTVTEWLPGRDSPLKVTDPNGNVTTYAYDSLGRTVAVRLPTEQPSGQPRSLEYTYLIDAEKDAVPIVQTRQLQSVDPNVFVDSWVIYDSLMRQRQTQTLSPASGKVIVTGTSYDTRGLVQDETAPQAVAGTPGRGRLATAYENKTRTEYDGLGRVSRQSWFNPESGSNPAWSSTTTYTHDTTTTTPPVGGQTRTQVDGLGRNVRVEEQYGPAWHATTYGYDLAGNLTSVTDPAGNTINYTYNLAGWRLTIDDPDSGVWSYGYDTAGRQTRVIDARQQATHTTYDVLGRPTERRLDSPTGGLVARWSYDAAGEKGLLDTSVRVTPEGEWVVDVAGYDSRGRALGTTWTVPAGVPGLSGDYSVRYAYDRGDHQTSVEHPAVGGLPAETVTTRYNSLGVPEYLAGAEEYVWSASYDDQARPRQLGFGPRPNGQTWLAQQISYDANQRVSRSVNATTTGSISDHQFTYDQVGNITERTTQLGSDSWRECFGYDDRQRLETAYTVVATATCADGTAGTGGQPYDHEYQYSADGNLLRRTQDGATDIYSYPTGAGADRPHAPTAVDDDTYHWDANGNLQSRTVDGRTEQLAWDRERRLASASGPDGTSSFLYGAGGARLLRTTPNERTFYFAGHEVTASSDGATVRAVRTYTFADGVVATRSPSGVDYAITDQQGSVEGTVASGGGLEARRAYNPYGSHRHTSGETDSDQAWIGQIRDETTDLAYLNARYYDPNIGRFISPDPLYDTARPQTINPYTYAASNPSTVSDPSGAYFPVGDGCRCGYDARFSAHTNNNNIARATRRQGESLQGAIHRVESKYLADKSQHERNVYVLQGMARANRNPGFWRALASAGSGEALALTGMRIGNPEPGFWEFMHRVLQVCSHCNREEVIRKAMNIRNYRQIAVAQAKMGDTGYGKWPDPPKKEDCGLMPCFVGDAVDAIGGAASKAGDAAAWVYTHAEVSFTACAKWCIGVGVQGGHGYFQVGAGCCFVGVNGGFAAHEYEDRPCLYGTGGIPITSGGVGVYSDQIIGTNGRIDSSAGLSFGAGGGGAVLRNVDTGIGASPVC